MSESLLCITGETVENIKTRVKQVIQEKQFAGNPQKQEKLTLGIVYSSAEDLFQKLELADYYLSINQTSINDSKGIYFEAEPFGPASFAFIFPGQGSQYTGMLDSLRHYMPKFSSHLHEIEDSWLSLYDESLQEIIYRHPGQNYKKNLQEPENSQPALGLVSLALARTLETYGLKPFYTAGHSYGELTALCYSGAFDLNTLFGLSRERGELQKEAGQKQPGTMLALQTTPEIAEQITSQVNGHLEVSNINAPNQVVISGETKAIQEAAIICVNQGIRAAPLNTPCAFHSRLMLPISERWKNVLYKYLMNKENADVSSSLPVYSNVTAEPYSFEPEEIINLLNRQIVEPVHWEKLCQNMYRDGARIFLETGPGKVLTNLCNRIFKDRPHLVLPCDPQSQNGREHMVHLLGRLASHGVPINKEIFFNPAVFRPVEVKEQETAGTDADTDADIESSDGAKSSISSSKQRYIQDFYTANQSAVEAFFKKQEKMIERVGENLSEEERLNLMEKVIETNTRILHDILHTHETGLSNIVSEIDSAETIKENGEANKTKPVTREIMPDSTAGSEEIENNRQDQQPGFDLEEELKKEIAQVTGVPENMLHHETRFEEDLGLNSLTMMEIATRMIKVFPEELDKVFDHMGNIRTIGDFLSTALAKTTDPESKTMEADTTARPDTASREEEKQHKPASREGGDLEKWVKKEIAQVTGVPEDMLHHETRFEEDLGLNSLTMMEIATRMIKVFPESESLFDNMGKIRTLGDFLALAGKTTESKEVNKDKEKQPEIPAGQNNTNAIKTGETVQDNSNNSAEKFLNRVKKHIAGYLGREDTDVNEELELWENFHISVFEMEEIIEKALQDFPGFKIAGRELINARNLVELRNILEKVVLPKEAKTEKTEKAENSSTRERPASHKPGLKEFHRVLDSKLSSTNSSNLQSQKAPADSPEKADDPGIHSGFHQETPGIQRFVPTEKTVQIEEASTLPEKVILAGAPGPEYNYFLQSLEGLDIKVQRLIIKGSKWETDPGGQITEFEDNNGLKNFLESCQGEEGNMPPLLFLASGDDCLPETFEKWSSRVEENTTGLFLLARALEKCTKNPESRKPGFLGVILSDFHNPAYAGAAGVLRTLRHDLSGIQFRLVTMEQEINQIPFARVAGALFSSSGENELILKKDRTAVKEYLKSPLKDTDKPRVNLGPHSLLLLVGGGDGITAETGCLLARNYGCHIAALGRTPWIPEMPYREIEDDNQVKRKIFYELQQQYEGGKVPPEVLKEKQQLVLRQRSIWKTKDRVESAGGNFIYYQADASEPASLDRVISDINQKQGDIHGVIHGAGIIEPMRDKTVESFRKVISTKSHSVFNLYRFLKYQPLQFVILFSSITSITGLPNLPDYSAANEILNAAGRYWNRESSYPVCSLLWTLWNETGLMKDVQKSMSYFNIPGISNQTGMELLHRELKYGSKSEDLVLYSDPSMLHLLGNPDT